MDKSVKINCQSRVTSGTTTTTTMTRTKEGRMEGKNDSRNELRLNVEGQERRMESSIYDRLSDSHQWQHDATRRSTSTSVPDRPRVTIAYYSGHRPPLLSTCISNHKPTNFSFRGCTRTLGRGFSCFHLIPVPDLPRSTSIVNSSLILRTMYGLRFIAMHIKSLSTNSQSRSRM